MPDLKVIEAAWKHYRQRVLPQGASFVKVEECQRAFYSGALSCFTACLAAIEGPEEEARPVLETIQTVLQACGAEAARLAGREH